MKTFLLISMISILMLSSSCSFFKGTVVPKAKEFAAENITKAIVKTGECKAVDIVRADVDKLLKIESDESMLVKALGETSPAGAQEEGIISEICKFAANIALPALLQKGVPDKWECTMTDLNSKIESLTDFACGKIPF